MKKEGVVLLAVLMTACAARSDSEAIAVLHKTVAHVNGQGERVGQAVFRDKTEGMEICVNAVGLTPGGHGFHIHQNKDCGAVFQDGKAQNALRAGGHYDPGATHVHAGPFGKGHAGDLPPLLADSAGSVHMCVTAPRLTVSEIIGRSVIIHAGGDNLSDMPLPLGGGGERVVCGVIVKE